MTFTLLIAAFLSVGHAKPADDFAFRLEYGLCTTDVLDTFKGVFVRDLGSTVPALTIPLVLSPDSVAGAHQAITAAHFFDYPSDFRITPTTSCTPGPNGSGIVCGGGLSAAAPLDRYRLQVREGGLIHTVLWRDNISPSTPEADRLRNMFVALVALIRGLPEVQRLPLGQLGCG